MASESRLQNLIDESVLWAYLGGVERHGTNDLVVYLHLGDLPRVFLRTEWLRLPNLAPDLTEIPTNVLTKVKDPPSATRKLVGNQTAFWFVARFPDDTMDAVAIISQRMVEGGDA